MRLIRPFPVSDVSLTSSDVTEADYSAWAAGTTYALGDNVQVVSPTFTATITNSATTGLPALFTATLHGFGDGDKIKLTTAGTLPTGLSTGTLYFITEATANTFNVSLTLNGNPIVTSSNGSGVHTVTVSSHKVYESLSGSNVGNTPHLYPAWWLEVSATNRYKMFDQSLSAHTSKANTVDVTIQTTGRNDSVAVLNVDAATIRIVATDAVVGVVYDVTTSLTSTAGIIDWYTYFFNPIERIDDFTMSDLPPYNALSIRVLLTSTGSTVIVGELVIGAQFIIGYAQYGSSVGIQDYSIKERDTFGNYSVLERAFNKRAVFGIHVPNGNIDALQRILAAYRATPVVFIGSDDYDAMKVLGFYKDFNVEVSFPSHSVCTLEVEGLT